jgi:hypothetical protein
VVSCGVHLDRMQVHSPDSSRIPSLAGDKVALVARPLHAVLSVRAVLVVDRPGVVGPERVVVAVVEAGAARGAGTSDEAGVGAVGRAQRAGEGAESSRTSDKKGAEGDHGKADWIC